jgi:hypothetical protein
MALKLTEHFDGRAVFGSNPFSVDESLRFQQT